MYENAEALVKNEIDFELKKQIYYCIINGIEIFRDLRINNIEIFDSELSGNILPRIMTFCVDRQFSPDIYVNKKGFESSIKSVNSFKYKVAELRNNKIVLNIAKIKNGKNLPGKANYKLNYAQHNNFKEQQLKLNLDGETNKTIVEPYYGIVTYSVGKDLNIESIELVIPSTDMETYIYKIDIKNEVERFKTVENDRQNQKTLVTLKEEFKKNQIIN